MSSRIPLVFKNHSNCNLFGILQKANIKESKKLTIILLSPGIINRVAPHRLYVKMAQQFTDLGFDVLRFDPEGMGDSEGEIVEDLTADVYASVETGRFVSSTIAAMDWMEKEHGAKRFILSGLCGGAMTGLLTAAQDDRVDSLLGLGIPAVLSAMKRQDPYKYITKGALREKRQDYLEKALSLKKWLRFLTFRSDYRMIFKSLLMSNKQPASPPKPINGDDQKLNDTVSNSNINPFFLTSMLDVLNSSRDICFIFSEKDRLYWEFEEKFKIPYQQEFAQNSKRCEISVIKNANHIFSFPEWEKDMMTKACEWLVRKYH